MSLKYEVIRWNNLPYTHDIGLYHMRHGEHHRLNGPAKIYDDLELSNMYNYSCFFYGVEHFYDMYKQQWFKYDELVPYTDDQTWWVTEQNKVYFKTNSLYSRLPRNAKIIKCKRNDIPYLITYSPHNFCNENPYCSWMDEFNAYFIKTNLRKQYKEIKKTDILVLSIISVNYKLTKCQVFKIGELECL